MLLRNKKTGEISKLGYISSSDGYIILQDVNTNEFILKYGSLAELNEEWEDYEEPKKHYEILSMGAVMERKDAEDEIFRNQGQREIGNYFETKEEAEKAVEKLKAWKRLKDKGFRVTLQGSKGNAWLQANWGNLQGDFSDVLLLFGGEE